MPPKTCPGCGRSADEGKFCASCGTELPAEGRARDDPLIGALLADRFRIHELIDVGGMGRVYRGVHQMLDREVAVKCIQPHLSAAPDVEKRFMAEARAVSRLQHPNIVTIFDFGRAPEGLGGQLYLVMELLKGSELGRILEREPLLPIDRIARILRQLLGALGEAHAHGITHRDVKPGNVILEPTRTGSDRVKLIDFGIAATAEGRRLTAVGQLVGTPHYMSPEQIRGDRTGAGNDLYAAGVTLYEMLTGQMPFESDSAEKLLELQLHAPRPDPREHAPAGRVPPALAELCLRAIALDPAERFASAEELADALDAAVGASLPPASLTPAGGPRPPVRGPATSEATVELMTPGEALLAARVPFVSDLLADVPAVLLWGRPGIGRTWVLRAAADAAARREARAVVVEAEPEPFDQVGLRGLRRIVSSLLGPEAGEVRPGAPPDAVGQVASGLAAIFDPKRAPDGRDLAATSAALRWACERAVEEASGRQVVLALDDVDRLDALSLSAVTELVSRDRIPGLRVLMTSVAGPAGDFFDRICHHEMRGWSRLQAAEELGDDASALARTDDDIEPLYVDQLRRWRKWGRGSAPSRLVALAAANVRDLQPEQQRLLLTLAVAGGAPVAELDALLEGSVRVDSALMALADRGLVQSSEGVVRTSHALFGAVVLDVASRAAVADAHRAAAARAAERGEGVELRAYHGMRGEAGFDSFLCVEEAARLRSERGDVEGAIECLSAGLVGAYEVVASSGPDADLAESVSGVFARKLGAALLSAGRVDRARELLGHALERTEPGGIDRALVLEQLAAVARSVGSEDDAERRCREALDIAERHGDGELAERISTIPEASRPPSRVVRRLVTVPPRPAGSAPPSSRSEVQLKEVLSSFAPRAGRKR